MLHGKFVEIFSDKTHLVLQSPSDKVAAMSNSGVCCLSLAALRRVFHESKSNGEIRVNTFPVNNSGF